MDNHHASSLNGKSYHGVPQIMIQNDASSGPISKFEPSYNAGGCVPQTNPYGCIISRGTGQLYPWASPATEQHIKQEQFDHVQTTSSMSINSSSVRLHNAGVPALLQEKEPLSSLHMLKNRVQSYSSPVGSANSNFLQLPPNAYMLQHAAARSNDASNDVSDIGAISFTPWSSRSKMSNASLKVPGKLGAHRLLTTGRVEVGSDDTEILSLMSPHQPLSPYPGSGVSDTSSFPSIITNPNTSVHLQRKLALCTSKVPDLSMYQSSPSNSLFAAVSPPTSSVLIPISSHGKADYPSDHTNSTYRVHNRKMCIEHNQSIDGTVHTTITNRITYKEHPCCNQEVKNSAFTADDDDDSSGAIGSEPMDLGNFSGDGISAGPSAVEDLLQDRGKPHTCLWEGCRQNFDKLNELVQHIEVVHVEKGKMDDYLCLWDCCVRAQKPFNARYKLLVHMRIHSGERPNKCSYSGCKKAFSRLENLKIHMRTHTGEKPYSCQFNGCSKTFSNSSDRSKHRKTHLDQKPYACSHLECGKRYTDPSSLRKHVKTHIQKKKVKSGDSRDADSNDMLDGSLVSKPLPYVETDTKPSGQKLTVKIEDSRIRRDSLAHSVENNPNIVQPNTLEKADLASSGCYPLASTSSNFTETVQHSSPSGITDSQAMIPLHHGLQPEQQGQTSSGMRYYMSSHVSSPTNSHLYGNAASPMQIVYSNPNEFPHEGSTSNTAPIMPTSQPPPNYNDSGHPHRGLGNHTHIYYDPVMIGTSSPRTAVLQ